MKTKIWWRDRFITVDPSKPPVDSKQLDSFLSYNNAPKCFLKTNNYWWKLRKEDGATLKVTRALYLLPLKEWLDIALDDGYDPSLSLI